MSVMLEYFQRVVALVPGTFFSIHYKTPGGIPGIAFDDFDAAEKFARTWARRTDIYLAMGAQAKREPNKLAIRKLENTVKVRNLMMDIDVKKDAYASTKEAAAACRSFWTWLGLPLPTVIVLSGTGGFHNYWTLSELIEPDEHRVLARQLSLAAKEFGLKFDSNGTVDLVHLFRVPDTLNYKTKPPSPVTMLPPGDEIPIDVMRAILSKFKVTPQSQPKPKQDSPNDDLRAGQAYRRPTIDQVAEHCPFIKETLATGGTNLHSEPQWHDMAALACHCVEPSITVHRLCSQNDFYTRDGTEKKLETAQDYRDKNPQLGPPKCQALMDNGASQCGSCPHLSLATTPLALPFKLPKPVINGYPFLSDLPAGYYRDDESRICIDEVAEKGDKPERVMVFPYPIYANTGYLEGGHPFKLTFTTWQGEEEVQKTFDGPSFSDGVSLKKAFLSEGFSLLNESKVRAFFMHYIHLLQSRKETLIKIPPLGWAMRNGKMGFAYDNEFVTPEGKFPCLHAIKGIADYKSVGEDKIWRDMANMVLTPDRPDLMVLAATAFSAPLVRLSGQHGYLIGAWSTKSGIGKTTALLLSQSVWAYPILGGFDDTVAYTFAKCASVQDLPVIYDEARGSHNANFVNIALTMTGGREKGRSDRSGKMRETRTWHTNIPYATNFSIVAAVADQTQGTYAGVYRIFEFQAISRSNQLHATDMARLTTQLNANYGGIGKIYADYLGQNYEKLQGEMLDFQSNLEKDFQAQTAERCWVAAISTTLLGAKIASKRLGLAPFDLGAMYAFMKKEFHRMRNEQRTSTNDYTNVEAIQAELAHLISEKVRNLIVTDKVWESQGRPPKGFARVLNARQFVDEIGLQIAIDPLTLLVRETFLSKWFSEHKKSKAAFASELEKLPYVKRSRARLASGTQQAGFNEWIFIIKVAGTPLEDLCEYQIQYAKKDLKP